MTGNFESNSGDLADRVFAKKIWYATALDDSAVFELICRGVHVDGINYIYISGYYPDGTLPTPKCRQESGWICSVLPPEIIRDLSRSGFRFKPSVESQAAVVQEYNALVIQKAHDKKMQEQRPKILLGVALFGLLICGLLIVGYVQRALKR